MLMLVGAFVYLPLY